MAERRYRFVQVDVFTRRPFGGSQLAVFTEADGLSSIEMQTIAAEMGFSESTFVFPPNSTASAVANGRNDPLARLRIFTPMVELPFAGHPVVGTGYVLGQEAGVRSFSLDLEIGRLRVEVDPGDGRVGSATMEQPIPRFRPADAAPRTLAEVLGIPAHDLAVDLPVEYGSAGVEFLYVPLRSLEAVKRVNVQSEALRAFFAGSNHPAIYPFSIEAESPEAAAHVRMFSLLLGAGVKEDAATGSAAGPLGAYLVRHGVRPAGLLLLEQGYEMNRRSQLEVEVEAKSGQVTQVRVGGGVVRVAEGHLFI